MRSKIEQFYVEQYDNYVRKISRKAGGIEHAEDIVQEAFYRALKYADTYNPTDKEISVWFNTILRRAMYDHKRIELKQGMTAAIDSGETEAVEVDEVGQRMADEIYEAILERKHDEHKQVLFLALIRNYPPRDIVEVLDVGIHNVNQIISRFKTEMGERYGYNRSSKSFS